jgi:hypothetical protein
MNVAMKIDPANALNGFSKRSGWAQGWGVIKGPPADREFAGMFVSRDEAEGAALKAGPGFEARWGSFDVDNNDFITGDT